MIDNINLINKKNVIQGTIASLDLIRTHSNQAVLWLSGGHTPKPIYEALSRKTKLDYKAVALIDERFGKPLHKNSNELMIQKTGLAKTLEKNNIIFYAPLNPKFYISNSTKQTSTKYNKQVKNLITNNTQHILILGLGPDGHTAGAFPDIPKSKKFVVSYKTKFNEFHERITLTPYALETLAYKKAILIILAFGKEKKEAIHKMLHHNPNTIESPSAIYHHLTNCGCQIYLITDQSI